MVFIKIIGKMCPTRKYEFESYGEGNLLWAMTFKVQGERAREDIELFVYMLDKKVRREKRKGDGASERGIVTGSGSQRVFATNGKGAYPFPHSKVATTLRGTRMPVCLNNMCGECN